MNFLTTPPTPGPGLRLVRRLLAASLLCVALPAAFGAPSQVSNAATNAASNVTDGRGDAGQASSMEAKQAAPAAPSSAAQKLYAAAQNDLLQIRVLLKNGRTQAAVGSGFLIGTGNLVVTNYHVVSQIALEPGTYVGEYVDTANQRGTVELLAVDALHDLAVVRVGRNGSGFFTIPERAEDLPQLSQGQYLYSLGNPLDLGFAISEGSYNGVIRRGFYDQLLFTGPINAGMSGGPNLTANGRVAGVNVAKRLDGELVSFLVPVRYVQDLLKKVALQDKPIKDFNLVVGQQLLAHQGVIVDKLLEKPFNLKTLGPYLVPVRESDQVRCWGRSSTNPDAPYSVDEVSCQTESGVYVSEQMQTGQVSIRHAFMRSRELGAMRFSELIGRNFKNQIASEAKNTQLTGLNCSEDFVTNKNLPLRAVLCVRAYRKFSGLYDFIVLTASTDQSLMNLQSRMETRGVSYQNGLRVARSFLDALGKGSKP
jgi:S1-C subfamily serine protease